MLNIADRPPPPGLWLGALAKALGFMSVFMLLLTCVFIVVPVPAAVIGMRLSRHMSTENAGLIAIAGSFIAGFWSSRILSRRCRWT